MTESYSPSSLEELRQFTLVCLEGYSQAAVGKMLEAEALMVRALELREEAMALFARANQLALEYAQAKASPVPEEEPNW